MSHFSTTFFHPLEFDFGITLPEKFTFPFYYNPHPVSLLAVKQLQTYLENQTDFVHNFGLNTNESGLPIGKMFGVMVVKNKNNDFGFLAAFSGKLADSNTIKGFVPTLYNTLHEAGFYKQGEAKLNAINADIEILENATALQRATEHLEQLNISYDVALKALKTDIKIAKKQRHEQRETSKNTLSAENYAILSDKLNHESIAYQLQLKHLKWYWEQQIAFAETHLNALKQPIGQLKNERATLSASLQKRIHEHYKFLNANGETKDLLSIFKDTATPIPPAGSGECAAPKLFQYAFENALTPIAMAEFWWGASPKSEVRKHKHCYPSCRSKCEPILGFMMQGLQVDENPIEQHIHYKNDLDIVFEDDYLLLLNKPHEFLSVPGKTITESVFTKMKQYIPTATGSLLVHRLDMSTSGLLLVAKNERIHKLLQKQFIERSIKKRYVALLDGVLQTTEGTINLPLRVDLDNRPQQLVCFEHGKPAVTNYQVIGIENGKTRIHFYPITGRTHQLRVHAAHTDGLKTPIVGDDLYGTKANRLHLHAESLTFTHPVSKEVVTICCAVPF